MGRAPTGRPTSFDIAYLAGVSQPTVSRALRGDKAVSEATRERIRQIARDLNYTVDKNASSLRSQRSNTIALLFFEDPTPDESMINPFFLAMLGSITRACASRGLDLLISFQRMEDDWHVQYQDSHRADGLILLGYGDYTLYEERLEQLQRQGTHFARWGSVTSDATGSTVGSDNFGAGRLVGEHLIAQGRRRLAFLGHADEHYPEFAQRYRGMCRALEEAGIAPDGALQADAITTEEAGRAAMLALLARGGERPDAIFAASDLIAIGAMRALAEAGLAVPGDVAVAGFDDIPAASLTSPPLTTMMQDIRGAGERLVETLLARIEERSGPDARLPTRLIVRGSTGACLTTG
ncbi:LacI family DNA-binding transcriptional regulator [Erythrobacter arachoides]|uniref:LacI family DNA-binding transcriptional regulator n=1 Tax=Aurantiacibacter arachoides TaxID=1850444 RepID=A0A845A1S0_9SPHN|nr:LacI family DNA-binding transcriptional regulator [Aurantiacibacter arachoides]MXO94085.1 LacI family DNA-binding transcriptional regulator [Aurantiacibacter arachoides]GGD66173.1 LacI family transcriptional regulator [Aurantiacibacter arachoides]